ncbi:Alpha/Beta hydrolase fold [Naviculisporaceae sp. PSN 640]
MSTKAPCAECIKGTIHPGTPIGETETLHGLTTYIVGNRTNPRGIIVMYSDVFGLALPNNKLIADSYAKSGEWLVYMPDFFQGDPVPLKMADVLIPVDATAQSKISKYGGLLATMPSYLLWTGRHKTAKTEKVCVDFLRELRKDTLSRGLKIGMVGFCWGGKYAIRAGLEEHMIEVDGKKVSLVDAVVALHPSHVVLPGDVEGLVVPVSYAWGEQDSLVSLETKTKIEDIEGRVRKAGTGERTVPEMEHRVYKPGRHGFAVRGNPEDPAERACLEDSVTQVLEWFNKWL